MSKEWVRDRKPPNKTTKITFKELKSIEAVLKESAEKSYESIKKLVLEHHKED